MTEKRDSNFQIFASNIARRITIALPALAKALSEEKNALVQKKLASILQAKGW